MPFIDTAVHLAPERVLISVCTATDPSELADAKSIVALGLRTEHDPAVADLDWTAITDADKASDDFNAAVHARLLGMRTARSAR